MAGDVVGGRCRPFLPLLSIDYYSRGVLVFPLLSV